MEEELPIKHIAAELDMWVGMGGWVERKPRASAFRLQRRLDEQAAAGTLQFSPADAIRTVRGGIPCRIILWQWDEDFKARAQRQREVRAKQRKKG